MFLVVTVPLVIFGDVRTGFLEGLCLVYVVGIVPALLTGLADKLFDGWVERRWRGIATGLVGMVISGVTLSFVGLSHYGLFGFFPAAVCSWLSGERQDKGVVSRT